MATYPHSYLKIWLGCLSLDLHYKSRIESCWSSMQIWNTMYGSLQVEDHTRSRFELKEEEMSGSEAASFIQDELLLDGTPALNLAGFATTYMGNEVEDLMHYGI